MELLTADLLADIILLVILFVGACTIVRSIIDGAAWLVRELNWRMHLAYRERAYREAERREREERTKRMLAERY